MIQVRALLFETNSSSTHVVVVHKTKSSDDFTTRFWFSDYSLETEFGRCESQLVEGVQNKIAYAYIVVSDIAQWKKEPDSLQKFLDNLYSVAEEFYFEDAYSKFSKDDIQTTIELIKNSSKNYGGYVDHVEDFWDNGFYRRLVEDKDFVRSLIFDEYSYITVGGDEYRGYNLKKIGFQDDYDDEHRNPSYKYEEGEDGYPVYKDPTEKYTGEFWNKVKELKKDNDIFFKGN